MILISADLGTHRSLFLPACYERVHLKDTDLEFLGKVRKGFASITKLTSLRLHRLRPLTECLCSLEVYKSKHPKCYPKDQNPAPVSCSLNQLERG